MQKQVEDLEQDEKNKQMMLNAQEDYFSNKLTKRINPFDEEDNLTSLNGDRGAFKSGQQFNRLCFSRRPFVELHTYYGLQFQKFFDQRSQQTKIVNDLILL